MEEGCWELFWKTGLPEIWLLGRLRRQSEAVAASAQEESGGQV